jgi:hypothetical protein
MGDQLEQAEVARRNSRSIRVRCANRMYRITVFARRTGPPIQASSTCDRSSLRLPYVGTPHLLFAYAVPHRLWHILGRLRSRRVYAPPTIEDLEASSAQERITTQERGGILIPLDPLSLHHGGV